MFHQREVAGIWRNPVVLQVVSPKEISVVMDQVARFYQDKVSCGRGNAGTVEKLSCSFLQQPLHR
jgi:hypothetical protein